MASGYRRPIRFANNIPLVNFFLRWTPAQVAQSVHFPSFSKSIKYPGFQVAKKGIFQFSMDATAVKRLTPFGVF
jgi:hypothetical protein